MTAAALLLGVVTAERIAELSPARSNTAALLAKGALEFAPRHYPAIVLMHALWLASLWIFGARQMIDPTWLAIFLLLQVLRVWILIMLGSRWTTRIIVLPGAPLISNGPYRIFAPKLLRRCHPPFFPDGGVGQDVLAEVPRCSVEGPNLIAAGPLWGPPQ